LLLKRGLAAPELGAFLVQSSGERFRGHEPLIHRGEFGAAGRKFILFRLDGRAKLDECFRKPRTFGIGFGAAQRGCGMLVLGAFGTLPSAFHVQADAREFILADGEFQPEASQFTLHLAVAVHGGDSFAFRFALLLIDFRERLFCET
jgi:hypothetical protein